MTVRISGNFASNSFNGTSFTTLSETPIFEILDDALPFSEPVQTLRIKSGQAIITSNKSAAQQYAVSSNMRNWSSVKDFPKIGSVVNFFGAVEFDDNGVCKAAGTASNSSSDRPALITCNDIFVENPTWTINSSSAAGGSTNRGSIRTLAYSSQLNEWYGTGLRSSTGGRFYVASDGSEILTCTGSGTLGDQTLATATSFHTYTASVYYAGRGAPCGSSISVISGLASNFRTRSVAANDERTQYVITPVATAIGSQLRYSADAQTFIASDTSLLSAGTSFYDTVVYGNQVFMIFSSASSEPPAYSTDAGQTWRYVPNWSAPIALSYGILGTALSDYDSVSKKIVVAAGNKIVLFDTEKLKQII